jgi:hypothetical protein
MFYSWAAEVAGLEGLMAQVVMDQPQAARLVLVGVVPALLMAVGMARLRPVAQGAMVVITSLAQATE